MLTLISEMGGGRDVRPIQQMGDSKHGSFLAYPTHSMDVV